MMRRKGRHWVTQQLRRALTDFAEKPEADLAVNSHGDAGACVRILDTPDDSMAGLSSVPFPPDRREGGDQRPATG